MFLLLMFSEKQSALINSMTDLETTATAIAKRTEVLTKPDSSTRKSSTFQIWQSDRYLKVERKKKEIQIEKQINKQWAGRETEKLG